MTNQERAFSFIRLNERESKPRQSGLTEIRGPYYRPVGKRYLEDILETMGAYVDNRWLREVDIAPALAKLDLLVLPYIVASQSGVIAAACGAALPVVVTPVGGLVEQVRDGESGIVAEAVAADAVAAAIARLATDAALYVQCSVGARALALGELSWPVVADRLLAVVIRG